MKRTIICIAVLVCGTPALAQDPPPAGGPDLSKVGPMSRPVTKEDKKGVDATFKAMEEAWKSGSADAVADLVDFPVIMLSDDATGAPKYFIAERAQWVAMMKPFLASMPKDVKMTHKHQTHFLSDTLAVAIEETSMKMGKTKGKWKGMSVLTLRDGKWKFKEMSEAGWGDMPPPAGATAKTASPANTARP